MAAKDRNLPILGVGITEAAGALGISVNSLRAIVHRGEIRYRLVGDRKVFAVSELQRWLDAAPDPERTPMHLVTAADVRRGGRQRRSAP